MQFINFFQDRNRRKYIDCLIRYMIKIAFILKNRVAFDKIKEYALPLLYKPYTKKELQAVNNSLNEYIWSVIEPYVEFINVNSDVDDILEVICGLVTGRFPDKQFDDFFYKTESSFTSPKSHLEIFYSQPTWSSYVLSEEGNMNNIGCFASLNHTVIENDCVIFSNSYNLENKNDFVTKGSVTKNDLIKIIRRRFFHTAVLIKNGTLVKYYYQNPIHLISVIFGLDSEKDSIETLQFSFLNYKMMYYFSKDKNNFLNETATRLCGHNKIYGNVLVLQELDEKVLTNLSIKEIQHLNLLSYGRLENRDLKDDENYMMTNNDIPEEEGGEDQKKSKSLWNRHLIRLNRIQKLDKSCLMCSKKIDNRFVCPNCCRAKYCSESCLNEDFCKEHYKECIYE
jgi:hypothetical protein